MLRTTALTSDYVESLPDKSGDLTLSSFRGRMGEGIVYLSPGSLVATVPMDADHARGANRLNAADPGKKKPRLE